MNIFVSVNILSYNLHLRHLVRCRILFLNGRHSQSIISHGHIILIGMTLYLHQGILGVRQDAALDFASGLFGRLVTSPRYVRSILYYRLVTVLVRRNFLVAFDRAVHVLVIHLLVSRRLLKTTDGIGAGVSFLVSVQVMRIVVAPVGVPKDLGAALALLLKCPSRRGVGGARVSVLRLAAVSVVGHQEMRVGLAVVLALRAVGPHQRLVRTHPLQLPYRRTLHHVRFGVVLPLLLRRVFEFARVVRLGHVGGVRLHGLRLARKAFLFALGRPQHPIVLAVDDALELGVADMLTHLQSLSEFVVVLVLLGRDSGGAVRLAERRLISFGLAAGPAILLALRVVYDAPVGVVEAVFEEAEALDVVVEGDVALHLFAGLVLANGEFLFVGFVLLVRVGVVLLRDKAASYPGADAV